MNIVLLGLPGAGKGTQARMICEDFGFTHLASGDMFRKEVKKETDLGKKAEKYLEKGELVPDKIAIKLIEKRVKNTKNEDFVFDGFPRNKKQAKALTKLLRKTGEKINLCIYLQVAENELIRRISGRVICSDCGKVYNVNTNPPAQSGKCNNCGETLYQRKDDQKEIVKKRIEKSKKRMEKVKDYYRNKKVLTTVESTNKTPNEVHEKVKNVLEDKLKLKFI